MREGGKGGGGDGRRVKERKGRKEREIKEVKGEGRSSDQGTSVLFPRVGGGGLVSGGG